MCPAPLVCNQRRQRWVSPVCIILKNRNTVKTAATTAAICIARPGIRKTRENISAVHSAIGRVNRSERHTPRIAAGRVTV